MYISVDLDDTLLHSDKCVSEYTLRVLRKCQELGHIIIINTARNYDMTKELMNIIKPDFTSVNAGAMIYDKTGNLVREVFFDTKITNDIISRILPLCEYMSIQTYDTLFTTNKNNNNPKARYIDINKVLNIQSYKILPYKMDLKVGKNIAEEFNIEYSYYFGGNWSRFSPPEVTKLHALEWIVKKTNGNMNDTISFGDDHGDLEMILGSNIGVAMANSQQSLLEAVSLIAENNNSDGVAKYLVDFLNINID